MSSLFEQFADLSQQQRALFLQELQAQRAAVADSLAVEEHPLVPIPRAGHLALSFAQQQLWLLAQAEGMGQAYHITMGLRLIGQLNESALRRALDRLVARHETLRTGFILVDGVLGQRIAAEDGGFSLARSDLRQHTDVASELERLRAEEVVEPFDLQTGPLIHGRLIQMRPGEHVLLITIHHIIADAWSMNVLASELSVLYTAYCQNRIDPLPALSVQYADYAAWQRRWFTDEVLQTQTQYWQRALAGAPALLELPTDRPRPLQKQNAGAFIELSLDERLTAELKALSQRHGTTLFMTLLAGWTIVLARLSGQDDVVIGVPVANRVRGELEPLIGLFVNTVAVRTDLSGDLTVRQLLQRVRANVLDAQQHQDLPFEQLVEAVKPSRHLGHNPVFQVMFAWVNDEVGSCELPGLTLSQLEDRRNFAKFDLTMELTELDGRITGGLEYSTALFDRSTVERHRSYLLTVLAAMAANGETAIDRLPLLSLSERHRILVDWNATQADYPPRLIHQLFEMQSDKSPDAVAIVDGEHSLTYSALNARANQLAHCLRKLGVGPDTRVAVLLHRSIDLVAALLAILKASGAYTPLDPTHPPERLASILADSSPVAVLTQSSLRPLLGAHRKTPVIDMQIDAVRWEGESTANLSNADVGITHAHLAYVIYTSGSTGRPKGIGNTIAGLMNRLVWFKQCVAVDAPRTAFKTNVGFVDSVTELLGTLTAGGTLVVFDGETTRDIKRFTANIKQFEISMLVVVPSLLRHLLDNPDAGLDGLNLLICSGERLTSDLVERLQRAHPQLRFFNFYGSSEINGDATAFEYSTPVHASGSDRSVIGRPIANTQIYVLGADGEPVPTGAVGELFIGGEQVARGYLNRPDLTTERFLADPFARTPGARMYKTGDLARHLADGAIEFCGRADFQIKIRGNRIELGEIEARLKQHPHVQECAVVVREDASGDPQLAAYVVPREINQARVPEEAARKPAFSLFYFGAQTYDPDEKYRLYLESARFADDHGFKSVWTPERHFHEVGSLYPNPALLSAALSSVTQRVQLCSGSVVVPLHHPIRVAEEWAVVDNLSGGRVGISVTSGWLPRDFALAPESFPKRKQIMAEAIDTLRALWRGETRAFPDGNGKRSDIQIFPKPIQPELPLWITAAGNPDTFVQAGRLGAHVLTHLLGQTLDELTANIARYREARVRHGHDPNAGMVTLMIHTFLGEDFQQTLERAREPFTNYMRSHLELVGSWIKSLDVSLPFDDFSAQNIDTIVAFAFERYSRTAALIGTPETCAPLVHRLQDAGVDELACLIDWMEPESALAGLPHLQSLHMRPRQVLPGIRELREYLKTQLPDYMLPATFTFLDALPLTSSGKLDRNALPAPLASAYAVRSYETPLGKLESTLARIWADILKVERVGRHDNFFELGGHSLLAVSLIERLGREGLRTEVHTLFMAPTPASLAAALGKEDVDTANEIAAKSVDLLI